MPRSIQTASEFLKALAPHLLGDLQPPANLTRFTRNPAVVGAYVENAVRALVARYLAPLNVSTGAVIDQSNKVADPKLPQIDTIVWTPSPLPAVFEAGEFAMVPRSSALAVLEIKSSAYDISGLDGRLSAAVLRKLVADPLPGEDVADLGMGVVCVRLARQSRERIARMRNASRVVVLLDQEGDRYVPRAGDIYRLVNFLAAVRMRARVHHGRVCINLEALT
jgi:hypothetical protein